MRCSGMQEGFVALACCAASSAQAQVFMNAQAKAPGILPFEYPDYRPHELRAYDQFFSDFIILILA
jgi:hypothetical protein